MSTDERTGVQAWERTRPGWPLAPGSVERRVCASKRHGTHAFMLCQDVVTGTMVAPSAGPTRTEDDVLAPMHAVVATAPEAMVSVTISRSISLRHVSVGSLRAVAARRMWESQAQAGSWPPCSAALLV